MCQNHRENHSYVCIWIGHAGVYKRFYYRSHLALSSFFSSLVVYIMSDAEAATEKLVNDEKTDVAFDVAGDGVAVNSNKKVPLP